MKNKPQNILPLFWITCLLLNLGFLVGCGDRNIIYKKNIDGVAYKYVQSIEDNDIKGCFTVKKKDDIKKIEFKEYIEAVAVDAKRSVAALLLWPWNESRFSSKKTKYWIVIIDTNSLDQKSAWEIIPDFCITVSSLFHPVMKFSDDGKWLSVFYYISCENKDIKQKQIITIWRVENVEMVKQIGIPKPEPDFSNHCYIEHPFDVAISPDNQYVAAYGFYRADCFFSDLLGPYYQKIKCSLLVFNIEDRSLKAFDGDSYYSGWLVYHNWIFHHDPNLKISWKVRDSGQRICLPNGKLWGNF